MKKEITAENETSKSGMTQDCQASKGVRIIMEQPEPTGDEIHIAFVETREENRTLTPADGDDSADQKGTYSDAPCAVSRFDAGRLCREVQPTDKASTREFLSTGLSRFDRLVLYSVPSP